MHIRLCIYTDASVDSPRLDFCIGKHGNLRLRTGDVGVVFYRNIGKLETKYPRTEFGTISNRSWSG